MISRSKKTGKRGKARPGGAVAAPLGLLALLACSPAQQDPCGKVSTAAAPRAAATVPKSPYAMKRGLSGYLMYRAAALNEKTSIGSSLEPDHARSAQFWFFKEKENGVDRYRFIAWGLKYFLSEAAQKDFVISVGIDDGFANLPVTGMLSKGMAEFSPFLSDNPGEKELRLLQEFFEVYQNSFTPTYAGIIDGTDEIAAWCLVQPQNAGGYCHPAHKLGVFIGEVDFSSARLGLAAPDDSVAKMQVRLDGFLAHQGALAATASQGSDGQAWESKLHRHMLLHRALYNNETRLKALTANQGVLDDASDTMGSPAADLVAEVKAYGPDCDSANAVIRLENYRGWLNGQLAAGPATVKMRYCLGSAASSGLAPIEVQVPAAGVAVSEGFEGLKQFTQNERKLLLTEILASIKALAALEPARLAMNINAIASYNTDPTQMFALSRSEAVPMSDAARLAQLGVNKIGFQSLRPEATALLTTHGDADQNAAANLNQHFQEGTTVSYLGLYPIQAVHLRPDMPDESGGLSYRKLPTTKTSGQSASGGQAPDEDDPSDLESEQNAGSQGTLDTSNNCR